MSATDIAFTLLEISLSVADSVEIARAVESLCASCDKELETAIMSHRTTFQNTWQYALDPAHCQDRVVLNGKHIVMQSIIDLVLKPMIGGMCSLDEYVGHVISRYFILFIRGITTFREKRRKHSAWIYTIENMIYNDMCRYYSVRVNESCLLLEEFTVGHIKVIYDRIVPTAVIISYKSNISCILVIEKYEKVIGDGSFDAFTSCKRTMVGLDGVAKELFKKVSYFDNTANWTRSKSARLFDSDQLYMRDPWIVSCQYKN